MVLPHVSKHFKYLPVKDHLLIAQKIEKPEEVYIYWDPYWGLATYLDAIRDRLGGNGGGVLVDAPPITVSRKRGKAEQWNGVRWDDRTDKVMKSLAEAFIDLRFASPERTQILIQDEIWPENISGHK